MIVNISYFNLLVLDIKKLMKYQVPQQVNGIPASLELRLERTTTLSFRSFLVVIKGKLHLNWFKKRRKKSRVGWR